MKLDFANWLISFAGSGGKLGAGLNLFLGL